MIRPATLDDLPALVALEELLFGADAWSEMQVRAELTGPGREVLVAEDDGLVGYVITMTLGEVADLQRIGVHPAHRRCGLATRLLDTALATSEAERTLLEVADDNEAALAFYTRRGFVEIARRPRYYRNGAAAIVMQLGRQPGAESGRV